LRQSGLRSDRDESIQCRLRLFDSGQQGPRELRHRKLFGSQLFESLLPVSGGREFIATLTGFISAPRERRTTRDSQFFFVNRRFVRDKTIAGGLLEGYRSILPHGVYPVAFLFLDIPLEEIDVNVHPAKTEIRFRRTEAVKDVIAEAVRGALAVAGIAREREATPVEEKSGFFPVRDQATTMEIAQKSIEFPAENVAGAFPAAEANGSGTKELLDSAEMLEPDFESEAVSEVFELAAEARLDTETNSRAVDGILAPDPPQTEIAHSGVLPPVNTAAHLVQPAESGDVASTTIRPMGQLHDSFIIAVDDEGLLLVDQHVAHERILFDKFRRTEGERVIESQNLLLPETVDLTPAQMSAFEIVEDELTAMGFGVMRLSGRTVAIKSIPTDLPSVEVRNVLAEILDAIDLDKRGNAKATIRDDIAASLACRAAVKINMKLTPEKMQWLIDRLLLTSSPTTCPHGRPVILRLTMKDIERGFHRA